MQQQQQQQPRGWSPLQDEIAAVMAGGIVECLPNAPWIQLYAMESAMQGFDELWKRVGADGVPMKNPTVRGAIIDGGLHIFLTKDLFALHVNVRAVVINVGTTTTIANLDGVKDVLLTGAHDLKDGIRRRKRPMHPTHLLLGLLRKGDKRNISLDAVEALAKECNVSYCEVDPDDKDTLDVVSLWLYVCASLLFKTTT